MRKIDRNCMLFSMENKVLGKKNESKEKRWEDDETEKKKECVQMLQNQHKQ